MKIAIVGYGDQGRAAYEYWREGNEITVCDLSQDVVLPEDVSTQLGEFYLNRLDRFDLIVRSPGLKPKDIIDQNGPDIADKITTVTNEFLRVCPSRNIIGVTGTKGKGTTSTLITRMLEADGKKVHLGGNIGIPPLDLLKSDIHPDDWVVLELANFQLIDLHYSPHIAVCLMVAPEHLDWHADTDEYYNAKSQMFRHQTSDDIAIYYANNEVSSRIASTSKGWKIPYMAFPGAEVIDNKIQIDGNVICDVSELKLLGKHNWQNVCAAVTTVWKITQNVTAIHETLSSFSGLPFRIELRRELEGVRYYDDSFASGPPATLAAIEAIPGPKIMLIGGFDRGLNLDELAQELINHESELRKVVIYGASGPRAVETFDRNGFKNYSLSQAKDMTELINDARTFAQEGDAIVLSPGFASFDMFKNFEDRGEKFNAAVDSL